MARVAVKYILKGLKWFLIGIVTLIILLPILVYIPFVQDIACKYAVKKINESTGMTISIDNLRLKFPLQVRLNGVGVIEASGDTMATVGSLGLDVKPLPLLKGDIEIGSAEGNSIFYQMGTQDSLMWLRANVRRLEVEAGDISLKSGRINVDRAIADGADVMLIMKPDTAATPVDTTQSTPWHITARDILLTDINYRMSMLPIIDSLGCHVDSARLCNGLVDMAKHRIHAGSLSVDSVAGTYLTPTAQYLREHPDTVAPDTTVTPPDKRWTVTADRLRLTGRTVTYATRGARPLPGLDMNYLQASDILIEVDSFFNCMTTVKVPLRRLKATERCGITLDASGLFMMDSTLMQARDFDIATMLSRIRLDGSMGVGDIMTDPRLPLSLRANANIAMADVRTLFPALGPILRQLPPGDLTAEIDIDGNPTRLNVNNLLLYKPRLLRLKGNGVVNNVLDPKRIGGDITLSGEMHNANSLKPTLLQARLQPMINIPDFTLAGNVNYSPGLVKGKLKATTAGGDVAIDAYWNGRAEDYDAKVNLNSFPVASFLPTMGIGNVTASLAATGHGYDPFRKGTDMDVAMDVTSATYKGETYHDVRLKANLGNGHAEGTLVSQNPGADLNADFRADIVPRGPVTLDIMADVRDLNLRTLHLTPDVNNGSLIINGNGVYDLSTGAFDFSADIDDLEWHIPGYDLTTPSISAAMKSEKGLLAGNVVNGDMRLDLTGDCALDTFMARTIRAGDVAMRQWDKRHFDVSEINRVLPGMHLDASIGTDNLVAEFLKSSDISFNRANLVLDNDSLLTMSAQVQKIATGSTKIDTLVINADQKGKYLVYNAYINNAPGTFDDFAYVGLNGYLAQDRMSAIFRQHNIKGEKGFQFGFRANLTDSAATVKFVPYNPIIAYKNWKVNKDNYVTFNFVEKHLDANLELTGDKSLVKLFTAHVEGDTTHQQEDIILQLDQVHLQDWLSISPYSPPIKGDLSADLKLRWDTEAITGRGLVSLESLYYGRDRVGDFDIDLNVSRENSGVLRAEASLMVDSVKTITASGVLNDSTLRTPFLLDFRMIRFPLAVVNPFLPKGTAKLSGMLNGEMDITGDMAHPIFNGYLNFDTTAVKVNMLGTSFRFSETKIPVDSNVVRFNNFDILACNDNPLIIDGTVSMKSLTDIDYNLTMKASDMQIVNSSRPRGADVYGKAFIDLDASARGNMSLMTIDASLALLPGTNVTYIIPDATTALTSRSTDDMVKFVSFSDTAQVEAADSIASAGMAMFLNAELDIREGSTVNVDLSADGKNKVQIQSNGILDYSLNPMNDGRLTGRLNINKGFARYTPPLMSEKLFNFREGSYVSFNGDMFNPILNIHAVDVMKANVTQEGQNSRLVNFDVSLAVTNTLENMNVAFDLSTDDDITVQNELQSMSAEQRANQAMNLLLYNVYTGSGTKATANLAGNPLYSFLEGQLNSWIANNIRGVDITFGIDQYDKTLDGTKSTATSYSYRVSKTLFNDRFKIIVGGNYSTDANADENFSQNLINDISFEYMLNQSGSMYVRIFRHTGYESILEGEITQTGVGFVVKRKIHSLRDLFRFGSGKKKTPGPVPDDTKQTTTPPTTATDEKKK